MVNHIMEYHTIYMTLAILFGVFMCWGIGANDVANAMGTSVGSGAITFKQAIIIAAIFEFSGAVLAGGHVTKTIRKGIIDPSSIANNPEVLIWGMLSALLAAGLWLLIASSYGWPVSTTHTIVGAIVGFAVAGIGMDSVNWDKITNIVLSWVVSPIVGGGLAFMLMKSIQKLILDAETPFKNAQKYAPYYIFLVGFIVAAVTFFKGLKHLKLELTIPESFGAAFVVGVICAMIGKVLISKISLEEGQDISFEFNSIEKIFSIMMVFTACAMAFAHGSNDVANGIGPMAAVVSILDSSGELAQKSALPLWILLIGGFGIVIGLATFGYKVIQTIGKNITELVPTRGFSAELAAASTVVIASRFGLPVSTTQIAVGAVVGVGFARGLAALNVNAIGSIFMSWVITLPAGAGLAMFFFFFLKGLFG